MESLYDGSNEHDKVGDPAMQFARLMLEGSKRPLSQERVEWLLNWSGDKPPNRDDNEGRSRSAA